MTATPPFVVSADDLIVRSAPRNQRASPSPGCIAMAVGDASGASGIDMGASLPLPQPFVQLRPRKRVWPLARRCSGSVAEHDVAPSNVYFAEPQWGGSPATRRRQRAAGPRYRPRQEEQWREPSPDSCELDEEHQRAA